MQDQDASDRPKDKIEALAELRDYKRRRQTYRGKNPTYNRRPATDVSHIIAIYSVHYELLL